MIPWFFEEAVGSWWSKLVFCRFFFVSYITTVGWNQNMIVTIKVRSLLISSPCVLRRTHHSIAGVLQCYQWLGWLDVDGFDGFGWSPGNRTPRTQPRLVHYNSNNSKLGVFQTSWTRNPTKDVFQGFQILFQNIRSIFAGNLGSPNNLETPHFFSDVFRFCWFDPSSQHATFVFRAGDLRIHDLTAKIGRWFFSYIQNVQLSGFCFQNWVFFETTKLATLRFADSTYHHPWFIQVCPFQAWCVCISTTINLMKIGGIGEWALWRFARKGAEDKNGEKITWVGWWILIYFGSRKICDPNFHDVTLPLFEYLPYRCRN